MSKNDPRPFAADREMACGFSVSDSSLGKKFANDVTLEFVYAGVKWVENYFERGNFNSFHLK